MAPLIKEILTANTMSMEMDSPWQDNQSKEENYSEKRKNNPGITIQRI